MSQLIQRAYAVLDVKAMDEEQRVITGMATTPTPDRVGDIIDPLGAQFTNPSPLLLYHDSEKPVGRVEFGKPTKAGIPFKAWIEKIDEPGVLKDRLDEAWQSVRAKLIRAVSIGFRALEYAFMENGGIRFSAVEIMELSLVSIPANADATINTIKSIDTAQRAASGQTLRPVVRLNQKPGASGTTQRGQLRINPR